MRHKSHVALCELAFWILAYRNEGGAACIMGTDLATSDNIEFLVTKTRPRELAAAHPMLFSTENVT